MIKAVVAMIKLREEVVTNLEATTRAATTVVRVQATRAATTLTVVVLRSNLLVRGNYINI